MAAVSERHHGAEFLYLPFAISVEDLQQQVKARLPDDTPVPSNEWIRLQFWPSDPYTSRAMHHTVHFDIKFRVQSRLVRAEHPDSKYVAVQYKYLKHFAVKFREYCLMICLDDKALDSFFNGRVFGTCKDKIFEQSSPFRHGVELARVLDNHFCNEGVLKESVVLLYTDGGPDQRLTYGSIQVSLLCLSIRFNLDLVIAV